MSEYKCTAVCGPFNLGEGPHWQQKNKCVYFVDAFVGDVYKFDTNSKALERKHIGSCVTIIIPWLGKDDHFVVSQCHELFQFQWSTGKKETLCFIEKEEKSRFNDGKCDRNNRLWIGTMGLETSPAVVPPNKGSLYCVYKDYSVHQKVKNASLSNGIGWSPDNYHLYFADSAKHKVDVFDFSEFTGAVSNQRVLVDYEKLGNSSEVPDGLTVDVSGKVWIACWDGSRIIRIDPETGKIINEVKFENVSQITSLCFGGPELNKLYVTSAWKGLTDENRKIQPLAGSLFEVTFNKENIKGFPGDCFNGNPL